MTGQERGRESSRKALQRSGETGYRLGTGKPQQRWPEGVGLWKMQHTGSAEGEHVECQRKTGSGMTPRVGT